MDYRSASTRAARLLSEVALLQAYYEAPEVLASMRWRYDPPQPTGHSLDPTDSATLASFETVKRRGNIWR